ncbi:MAG: hypothetical protein C4527_17480 [Candidatus Omnitrophota bacterium]|jgi:hypothetical protein|nr:MAG: hypothetical protein C4527_17480 [Candidatus Omnitrophota bacterium]
MPFYGLLIYILVMAVIHSFRLLPETRVEVFNDAVITGACLLGAVNFYRVSTFFIQQDAAKRIWILACMALSCHGVGHLLYSTTTFFSNEITSFFSAPDIFITLGEFIWLGCFGLYHHHLVQNEFVDCNNYKSIGNIIALFLAALFILLNFYPILIIGADPIWKKLIFLIYPLLDVVIAYFCVHLALAFFSMGRSPLSKPCSMLVCAYALFLITDSMYSYYDMHDLYHPYLWINIGWGLGYLLVSHASYLQLKLMKQMETS